jgi:hypothetical protein
LQFRPALRRESDATGLLADPASLMTPSSAGRPAELPEPVEDQRVVILR